MIVFFRGGTSLCYIQDQVQMRPVLIKIKFLLSTKVSLSSQDLPQSHTDNLHDASKLLTVETLETFPS